MAPKSQVQFIDTALSCNNTPFALSYTNPDQKRLIRKHLVSLLQDFPYFRLSFDAFTHNDGTIVNLLNANGSLHISNSTPPVPLTIWIHENYPSNPPIVIVSSEDAIVPLREDHPFVDPSGVAIISYLEIWQYPGSNLSSLVRKLVKLFTYDHPFLYIIKSSNNFTHPSFVSKNEAIDRLVGQIHYDVATIRSKAEEEIDHLVKIQAEMISRIQVTDTIIEKFEQERFKLKELSGNLANGADVIFNWIRANDPKSILISEVDEEQAYEGVDDDSEKVIDFVAASKSIDDLIYAMDKAFENGVMSLEIYIKQVRVLAREQFMHKLSVLKFIGHDVLHRYL
ncbi:hypothetical protein ACFE04_013573 [Oxalis oulophora]